MNEFPILDVSSWPTYSEEQVGSKRKRWLFGRDGNRWLVKFPRPRSGEHWAEVVAAAVCELLRIPHAEVELAMLHGESCTVSRSFLRDTMLVPGNLILGNALLATTIEGYDAKAQKPAHHSVEAVLALLASPDIGPPACVDPPPGVAAAPDFFVAYLMLDALIGNTDRHHENWGVELRLHADPILVAAVLQALGMPTGMGPLGPRPIGPTHVLAPTFDHASSLGRNLGDDERSERLTTRDQGRTVEHYCTRGRSPLYARGGSTSLTVRQSFELARACRPGCADAWIDRLAATADSDLLAIVDRLPAHIASGPARAFAKAVLTSGRRFLLSLRSPYS